MPIKIFFCYAHEDEVLLNKLKTHLRPLQRRGLIDVWYDRDICAGAEWEKEIDKHLSTARVILLLVSPDFMDSDHCHKELQYALERYKNRACRVIPILLRPTNWKETSFSKFQMLPSNAMPITLWPNLDEAFENVIQGINRAIENENQLALTKDDWYFEGKRFFDSQQYEKALDAFDQVLLLDPHYVPAHAFKGIVFNYLGRYQEAITVFNLINLPIPDDAHKQPRNETEAHQTDEEAPQVNNQKLIAVVEDDANMASIFIDILEKNNHYRTQVFTDGQIARDHLPEIGADLVILDIGLPNLDGASLYKILRKHSNTQKTPIIVVTGSYDWELHRMGLQESLHLRKPFHMEELLRMIQDLLPEN